LNYGLSALGGTRLTSTGGIPGIPIDPTAPTGPVEKSYASVLRDLLGLNSPS
jgi:hypothetical protein